MARLALASLAVITIASFARALTLDVPRLPAPTFADREVSSDAGVPATAQEHLRSFRLELSFDATPSNNVQVAFGQDGAPVDSKLAAEETAFIIGWDSGEWFLRPSGLKERHTCAPANGQTARRRTLKAVVNVNSQGAVTEVVFEDDTGPVAFAGLALDPSPEWLKPRNWNLLRVTVRGAEVAAEDVTVRFVPDGAIIILR